MSNAVLKVIVPPTVAAPRGALWAAEIALALAASIAAAVRRIDRSGTGPAAPRANAPVQVQARHA